MIDIYLPIADVTANLFLIILTGLATGFISGLFGLGGGLISIPALTILGIPPVVAVVTATNQMTSGTLSACLEYATKGRVDYGLGIFLIAGGILGNFLGIITFEYLQKVGALDSFILSMLFLLITLVCIRSFLELYNDSKTLPLNDPKKLKAKSLKLPWQRQFISIENKVSAIIPFCIGIIGGLLVILLGLGGGFLMIPAMLFIFKMNERFISGTVQFQIIFTSIMATFLHNFHHQQVDIILAFLLIIGTVMGAQAGAKTGLMLNPKRFKSVLLIVLIITGLSTGKKLFFPEFIFPDLISPNKTHSQILINNDSFNIFIQKSAQNHPTLYTIFAILIALFFGYISSFRVERKSKH